MLHDVARSTMMENRVNPGDTHQADLQFFNWSSSADSEHCRGEPALHRGHILHVCGLAAMIEHEHENHDTPGICLDTMNIIKNRNPWKTTLQMQKLVRTRWLWSVLHLPGAWRTTTFVLTWRLHDSGGGSFNHSMSRPCRFCTTFWTLMRSREWRYSPLPQLMQTHRQHGREIVMMFPYVSCLLSKGSSHLQGSKKCKQLWPLWRNDVSRCSLAAASAELFCCHIRLLIQQYSINERVNMCKLYKNLKAVFSLQLYYHRQWIGSKVTTISYARVDFFGRVHRLADFWCPGGAGRTYSSSIPTGMAMHQPC